MRCDGSARAGAAVLGTQIFEPTSRSNFRCASDRDRRTASANPQPAARNARGRAVRLPSAGAQCARCRSADPANNLMEKDRRQRCGGSGEA